MHLYISLFHHPHGFSIFKFALPVGKLMSAFLSGLSDRNASIRKSYASALGQLVKVSECQGQIFKSSCNFFQIPVL